MVTTWRNTVRDLLEAAGTFESKLADSLGIHKVVLNRYLIGARRPNAETVRKVDRHVERLIGKEGVAVLLDLAALQEGLLDVDDGALAEGALSALKSLDDRRLLVRDWRERFAKRIEAVSGDDKAVRALIAAVFYADRKPLLDDILGKTPAASSYAHVRKELSKRGLSDLFAKPPNVQACIDTFATVAREALLAAPMDTRERLEAEARLMRAAWRFAGGVSGVTDLQLTLGASPQVKGTE